MAINVGVRRGGNAGRRAAARRAVVLHFIVDVQDPSVVLPVAAVYGAAGGAVELVTPGERPALRGAGGGE